MPTHLHTHLLLPFPLAKAAKAKECASHRTAKVQTLNFTALNVNRLEQSVCGLQTVVLRTDSRAADNKVCLVLKKVYSFYLLILK